MESGGWLAAALTVALRSGSVDELASALALHLKRVERTWVNAKAQYDLEVDLAPFLDCAQRLGGDPVVLFDRAAERVSPELADVLRPFARRDDVSLAAFGWALEDSPTGPAYVKAGWGL